jgi:tetratricopeptide (TPR) repeat protein
VKGAAAACFEKGDLEGAAQNYIEAADLLHRSVVPTDARDVRPSALQMRTLGMDLAKIESNISLCLMKCGNADLALQAAEAGTKVCPEFAKGWARKGAALTALGRYSDAAEAFAIAQERAAAQAGTAAAVEYAALAHSARRADAKTRN